jgi:adenylate kinase family enzyme
MLDPLALQTIFERIEAGKPLNQQELQTLRKAAQLQQITIATGNGAVGIGGSADGGIIVTGDRNVVITGSNAEAIRTFMDKKPRHEELLLEEVNKQVNTRLQKSLFKNGIPIKLGMDLQPIQVRNSCDSDIKIGNKFIEPIPESRGIMEVFFQTEVVGKLLILGRQGSGKTTIMLELAKQLCERAKHQANFPIPVLLNLSMWKDTGNPMQDWLVTELNSNYGLRKDIWTNWVNDAQLLPMLDGLDELPPAYQKTCVKKINEFLQSDCRPQYLVVCSRLKEYEEVIRGLSKQDVQQESEEILRDRDRCLNLNNAVILKNLTYPQIKSYLRELDQTEDLWEILQTENQLLKLVETPLFLAIFGFISTQKKFSIEKWKQQNSTDARHQYIFDAYWEAAIGRELVYPSKNSQKWRIPIYNNQAFTTKQTRKWLVYLAQKLQSQHQTEFLIERIQPGWLFQECNQQIYALGVGCLFGFIVGSITTIINFIIIFHFLNIFVGLIVGLIVGIFVAIFSGLWAFLTIGQSPNIEPVETLNISGWSAVKSLCVGSFIGFISWILTLVAFPLLNWKPPDLVFFLVIAPILISILEMSGPQLKITIEPNQGIKKSFYNAICFASLGSVWLGLSAYVMREKIFVIIISLLFHKSATSESSILSLPDTAVIVIAGMFAGTLFGLTESGIACIQHFILRLILCRLDCIPFNYGCFLDYCHERMFLQRVGGRYSFIHELLQKHFAAMPRKK